jgi:hypothetical protein
VRVSPGVGSLAVALGALHHRLVEHRLGEPIDKSIIPPRRDLDLERLGHDAEVLPHLRFEQVE